MQYQINFYHHYIEVKEGENTISYMNIENGKYKGKQLFQTGYEIGAEQTNAVMDKLSPRLANSSFSIKDLRAVPNSTTYLELVPMKLIFDPSKDMYLEIDAARCGWHNWVRKEELFKRVKQAAIKTAQESNHLVSDLDQALRILFTTARAIKLGPNGRYA